MAKRKKIEVNILSFKSIELAIKELKAEKERQEELIDKFMDKVALGVCSVINSRIFAVTPNENNVSETDPWGRWNTDITMAKYDRDGHNRKISVSGSQVAFIEFGAGAEANPGIYPTKGGEKEAFFARLLVKRPLKNLSSVGSEWLQWFVQIRTTPCERF